MDITPLIPAGRQVIEAYGEGGFRISGLRLEGSVLVFPERTLAWAVTGPGEITPEALDAVFAARPPVELLLLGCGARGRPPEPALLGALRARKVAVESMDTGAACRTYNVLMAEDRRVAAALIALDG